MKNKIKRVCISIKDQKKIETIGVAKKQAQPQDYKDKVVIKPWGYEYLLYENDNAAIWILHVRKGQSTSMHAHPNKKTSLIVLSGRILCNTFYKRYFMDAGEAVIIEKGVFHLSKTVSLEEAVLMEVETPVDKEDLVRLNDVYGRIHMGYEGTDKMVMNASLQKKYRFAFLDDAVQKEIQGEDFVLQINEGNKYLSEREGDDTDFAVIYCVLSNHEMIGEALDAEEFLLNGEEFGKQTVLKISVRKEDSR